MRGASLEPVSLEVRAHQVDDERVIGVMAMFSRSALSDSTLHAMSLVADHIGLGIQRKLAEQRLRQKQERLTLALQAGRMGVYDWDMVSDAVWPTPAPPVPGRSWSRKGYGATAM